MPTIQMDLPGEVLIAMKGTPDGLSQMIRIAAAVKRYELRKLSSRRTAELAGIHRVSFLQQLDRCGSYTFDLTEDELIQEVR